MWFSSLIINGVLLDQQSMNSFFQLLTGAAAWCDVPPPTQSDRLYIVKVTDEGSPEMNVELR